MNPMLESISLEELEAEVARRKRYEEEAKHHRAMTCPVMRLAQHSAVHVSRIHLWWKQHVERRIIESGRTAFLDDPTDEVWLGLVELLPNELYLSGTFEAWCCSIDVKHKATRLY